ncbi:MAG: hypothetical protein ABIA93_01095 [Candidatus Woesearchaeota archaeon]
MIVEIIILVVFLGLVVASFFWHSVRSVMRIVGRVSLILVLVLGVLGAFVISDANAFSRSLEKGKVLFVLEQDGRTVTGTTMNAGDPEFLDDRTVQRLPSELDNLKEYDRIIVLNWSAVISANVSTLKFGDGIQLSKQDLLDIVSSEDDREALTELIAPGNQQAALKALESTYQKGQIKSMVFSTLVGEILGRKDLLIIHLIKKGEVSMIPSGWLVRASKWTPEGMLSKAGSLT